MQSVKDLARHCNGGDDGRMLTEKCYWSRPRGTNPWAVCDFESEKGCNRLQEIVEKDPKRPVKLYQHGAVIFGGSALPRKKCRPSKKKEPEKDPGAINGVSIEATDTQQTESFVEECRALAAALAQRHDRHENSADVDELIKEGRAIFEQFRQQGLKLQKQKSLVDEMSMLLGSTPESAQGSS